MAERIGCANHGCAMRDKNTDNGMGTNAICRCVQDLARDGHYHILDRHIRMLRARAEKAEAERDAAVRELENVKGAIASFCHQLRFTNDSWVSVGIDNVPPMEMLTALDEALSMLADKLRMRFILNGGDANPTHGED